MLVVAALVTSVLVGGGLKLELFLVVLTALLLVDAEPVDARYVVASALRGDQLLKGL